MKIEAKGFKKKSCCEQAGRLSFVAENEADAVQLAGLADWWMNSREPLRGMRKELLEKWLEKKAALAKAEDKG